MKKVLLFLLFAVSFTAFSQVQIPQEYTIQKPLRLGTVNPGKKADSVLVRGSDNIVKFVPQSSLEGSPNLDQVLATGNSTDTIVKIRTIQIGNVLPAGGKPKDDGVLIGSPQDSVYSMLRSDGLKSYYFNSFRSEVNGASFSISNNLNHDMNLDNRRLVFGAGYGAELSFLGSHDDSHRKIFIPRWDRVDPLEREKNIPLVINGQSADEYGNLDIDINSSLNLEQTLLSGNKANASMVLTDNWNSVRLNPNGTISQFLNGGMIDIGVDPSDPSFIMNVGNPTASLNATLGSSQVFFRQYQNGNEGVIQIVDGKPQIHCFDVGIGGSTLTFEKKTKFGTTEFRIPDKGHSNLGEYYTLATTSDLAADNATLNSLTLTDLNVTYPNAVNGFRVHCPSISTGALIYEKTQTGWLEISASIVYNPK